jgi:hypothetical protein
MHKYESRCTVCRPQPFLTLRRALYNGFRQLLLNENLKWFSATTDRGDQSRVVLSQRGDTPCTANRGRCTLSWRWNMRSKSKEMTTMTEQTPATIHIGVCSSVISSDVPQAVASPPAMANKGQQLLFRSYTLPHMNDKERVLFKKLGVVVSMKV